MSLIDKIQSAQAADKRLEVRVERWGTTLFFRPATGRDMEKLTKRHPDFFSRPTLGALVDMIVWRAEDEHGEKVFTEEHRMTLLSEPAEVIGAIGKQIMPQEAEETEKNS